VKPPHATAVLQLCARQHGTEVRTVLRRAGARQAQDSHLGGLLESRRRQPRRRLRVAARGVDDQVCRQLAAVAEVHACRLGKR
jgi:hypothetical protein